MCRCLAGVSAHSVATLSPSWLRCDPATTSLSWRSRESRSPCLVTVLERTSDTRALRRASTGREVDRLHHPPMRRASDPATNHHAKPAAASRRHPRRDEQSRERVQPASTHAGHSMCILFFVSTPVARSRRFDTKLNVVRRLHRPARPDDGRGHPRSRVVGADRLEARRRERVPKDGFTTCPRRQAVERG